MPQDSPDLVFHESLYNRNVEMQNSAIPRKTINSLVKKRRKFRYAILKFALGGYRRNYPWRESGRTPYEVLLAEVLLKRTTATAAARVYSDILQRFPRIERLNNASEAEIAASLTPIGLQRQRARSVKRLAEYLVNYEEHSVPDELERLLRVPGVGDYSARAVLSFAFGVPVAVVDSNVERVLYRVFRASFPLRPSASLYQAVADELLSTTHHRAFNLGMLDLGALICRPADPRCNECPLRRICDYYDATTIHPRNAMRKKVVPTGASLEPTTRLRALRKARGLSLVRLSKKAHVSKLTIIKIESGRTTPRPETIAKLASALGSRIEDLK